MGKTKNKYEVWFRGTRYIRIAENAVQAMEKFARHRAWGRPVIFDYKLQQYDAATLGEEWGEFLTDENERVMISREE